MNRKDFSKSEYLNKDKSIENTLGSDGRRILKYLEKAGLENAAEASMLLEKHITEIKKWNSVYKLVAESEDLVERHVLDSLAALPVIRNFAPHKLADIGSGAGFPGIPLAVCMPDCEVTLVERMGRRAGFLRNASVMLGLKNLKILEAPVEELKVKSLNFDIITFRAWKAMDCSLLNMITPLLASGGCIAAYKGRRETLESEVTSIESMVSEVSVIPLESVQKSSAERNLLLVKP